MPLLKPSTPPKKSDKPAGKIISPKKGETPQGKSAPKGKDQQAPPPAAPRPALTLWDQLSAERRLDVIGIGLAFLGLVIILGLASANRSAIVGGAGESAEPFAGGRGGWLSAGDQCRAVCRGRQGQQGDGDAAFGGVSGEGVSGATAGWGKEYAVWGGLTLSL